jgi:hypothetical protein
VKRFGKILGEKNKVLSSDLKEAAIEQPLIYNKNFYYTTALEVNMIYSDKLIQEVLQCYKDAAPLSAFFEKALKS